MAARWAGRNIQLILVFGILNTHDWSPTPKQMLAQRLCRLIT